MSTKKIIIISILTGIVIIISAYLFSFPMKKTDYDGIELTAFNKDDFVDVQKVETNENGDKVFVDHLKDKNKLVAQQGNYSLFLDETTSYFRVEDSSTGKSVYSNPVNDDSLGEYEKSTISLSYLETSGSINTARNINNYSTSIYHKKTTDYLYDGRKTYSINYNVKNGFQILYRLVDLEIDYLSIPRFITKEVYDEVLKILNARYLLHANDDPEVANAYFVRMFNFRETYKKDTNNENIYMIAQTVYESMTDEVLKNLYEVYYPIDKNDKIEILGDYSVERVVEENGNYDYYTTANEFFFEIAVEVVIHKDGIQTKVLRDSIKESKLHRITEISLYPMFGAVKRVDELGVATEGTLVVPDGSGAVINFNNGKGGETNAYKGRMYGYDLANLPYSNIERQKLIFPLYGMNSKDYGFAAVITEGDAMASVNANVSSDRIPYNTIHTSFSTREMETVRIGNGISSYTVILSTNEIVKTDFEVKYYFLESNKNNYTGVAKRYQEHLINDRNMEIKDKTKTTNLTLELLGAFDMKKFVLGVPYTSQNTSTTFEQANEIINSFDKVKDKTIIYKGVFNGGLKQSMATKVKIEKKLGSKKGFNNLQKELSKNGVNLYVNVKFATVDNYGRPLDQFKYNSRRISGENAREFEYDNATNIFKEPIKNNPYVLSPLFYDHVMNKFSKNKTISNIQLDDIGSKLAGSYTKKNTIFKQDALKIQKELLEKYESGLTISEPLGFAIPYADHITDLPTSSTLFSIIDYEIPLIQLVLSGVVDYTTSSINLTSSRSIDYEFLKALETGSNLKYTFSYENSVDLINTEYNNYFSTYYKNWENIVNHNYNTMEDTKIHEGYLVGHERLTNNVYKSIYSNGVVLLINYNPHEVVLGGKTLPAIGFLKEVTK